MKTRSTFAIALPAVPVMVMTLVMMLVLSSAPALADQNDPKLAELFKQLHAARDAVAAAPLEAAIWQLWVHHDNSKFQALMDRGIAQINSGNLQGALTTYNELVKLAPDYAEAWNKRATVHYLLENYDASEKDIQQTLKLEPFHFGALSGRGLVKLGQRDLVGARNAFHAVLEVYPAMDGVKRDIEELDEMLSRRSI